MRAQGSCPVSVTIGACQLGRHNGVSDGPFEKVGMYLEHPGVGLREALAYAVRAEEAGMAVSAVGEGWEDNFALVGALAACTESGGDRLGDRHLDTHAGRDGARRDNERRTLGWALPARVGRDPA